jgi:hypothetical protein
MKKGIITIIILILNLFGAFLYSQEDATQIKREYAKKKTLELTGGIGFSVSDSKSRSSFQFFLTPSVNYFIIDHVYIGFSPQFSYSYDKYSNSDNGSSSWNSYSFSTSIKSGYVFQITKSIFFDIHPEIGYVYQVVIPSEMSRYYSHDMGYGLVFGPIFDSGAGLISTGIMCIYHQNLAYSDIKVEDNFILILGIGYSIFFNL